MKDFFKNKGLIILCIIFCMLAASCKAISKARYPVYPQVADVQRASYLELDNQTQFLDYMVVAIDGFSPTDNYSLPRGITKLKLEPGSHEIIHTLERDGNLPVIPVTMSCYTESGKTYSITFKRYRNEDSHEYGYTIAYKGWKDEEIAQWDDKNPIRY